MGPVGTVSQEAALKSFGWTAVGGLPKMALWQAGSPLDSSLGGSALLMSPTHMGPHCNPAGQSLSWDRNRLAGGDRWGRSVTEGQVPQGKLEGQSQRGIPGHLKSAKYLSTRSQRKTSLLSDLDAKIIYWCCVELEHSYQRHHMSPCKSTVSWTY